MTKETFNHGMTALAATWPERKATADTLSVYWLMLNQLDDRVFEAAVAACLGTCKFFPVIAELREKAIEALTTAGILPPTGEQAWAQLLDAMRFKRDPATGDYSGWDADNGWVDKYGYTIGAPSPLPPMVEQAVRAIGGLKRIGDADMHEFGFIRKEFVSYYDHRRETELTYNPAQLGQALPALALTDGRQ